LSYYIVGISCCNAVTSFVRIKILSSRVEQLVARALNPSTSTKGKHNFREPAKVKWFFQLLSPAQVETEITQRDQFSNDNVSLNETIVREAVQNSLDAGMGTGEQVKVSFRWLDLSAGLTPDYFDQLLSEQVEHARSAELPVNNIDFQNPTALVIEDFGTKGLTGSTTKKDNNNFSDFWRRHGKSHKSGKSRGRWGLGKLVYSTTSELGVFFGLTLRDGDPEMHLMGQSVLNLYEHEGKQYLPHSFFADQSHPGDATQNLPVPITGIQLVDEFRKQFSLERTVQSGLSIVIPFPDRSFDQASMVKVAIENYFYPIITGNLTLVFDDVELHKENIHQLAYQYAAEMYGNIDELFNFIEEASSFSQSQFLTLRQSWVDDKKLGEDDFELEELDRLKNDFGNGKLCAIRLPLQLRPKNKPGKEEIGTWVNAFIKRPVDLEVGLDLYVRGGLTLPEECKFKSRRALGVIVAEEDAICDFLGDAENPAHTKWNLGPEKLKKKYVAPQDTVRVIKYALTNLYDLLAGIEQVEDDKVLGRFFSFEDFEHAKQARRGSEKKGDKDKTKTKAVVPKIKRKKMIKVEPRKGGFSFKNHEEMDQADLPMIYRARLAYDNGSSNAYRGHSPYDFSLKKRGGIAIEVIRKGTQVLTRKNKFEVISDNEFQVRIERMPFELHASGFDEHRDLLVDVNRVKLIEDQESD